MTDGDAVSSTQDQRSLDEMVVVAIELIVAVGVWGLAGLLLDLLAGTGPWLQVVGIVLGTVIALALNQRHATPVEADGDAHG